jgi:hypothetical protein
MRWQQHTWPFKTYESPSRTIVISMLVASLDATWGSVMRNAERISPLSRGSSHLLFCCSVPYLAITSMLPVSGAAQLTASEAVLLLPRYSAIRPYSRLLKPAPSLKCALGRNMFQSPSSWARFFRSSITDGCDEKRSCVVFPIWRTYTASAGMHSSSTNFST